MTTNDPVVGFTERVTGETIDDRADALAALREADPAAIGDGLQALFTVAANAERPDHRRRALDAAYPVVSEVLVSLDALPVDLFAALDDEATRLQAAAVVRALNCSDETVRRALTDDDARKRGAATRYLEVAEVDEVPVAVLETALSDDLADVRAGAAAALCRAVEREQCNDDVSVSRALREAVPALAEATADPDPRVRADAATAVAKSMFDDGLDEDHAATGARRLGRAVAEDDTVRTAFRRVVETRFGFVSRSSDVAVVWYAIGFAESATAADLAEFSDHVRFEPDELPLAAVELPTSTVTSLVDIGWDIDASSSYARELVAAIATAYGETVAERAPKIRAGVTESVGVETGASVLYDVAVDDAALKETFVSLTETLSTSSDAAPVVAELAIDRNRVATALPAVRDAVAEGPTVESVEALATLAAHADDGESADVLFDCATDETHDPDVRLAAASGCARLVGETDALDVETLVDVLVAFVASPEEDRRRTAARALATVGDSADRPPAVAAAFRSTDEGQDPLATLAEAAPDRATEAVESLCASLEPAAKWDNFDRLTAAEAAVEVDGRVGAAAVPHLATAVSPWGIDTEWDTAPELLSAVAAADPAAVAPWTDRLGTALADGSPKVREEAATALGYVAEDDPGAVPASLRALATIDEDDGRWPMGILARDAPVLAEQALAASLSFPDRNPEERAALLAQVHRTNPELAREAVDWLGDLLRNEVDVYGVATTVEALADESPSLAVRLVDPLAEYVDGDSLRGRRRIAVRALAAVGNHRPEAVRVAFDLAVDRSPSAYRENVDWLAENDVDDLFDAVGIDPEADRQWTDRATTADGFWESVERRL